MYNNGFYLLIYDSLIGAGEIQQASKLIEVF